jgi:hypothetical protein
VDLAVAITRAARIAVRVFVGTLRLVWRVCAIPVRILVPPKYPEIRAVVTGLTFCAVVVAVDLVLTGGPQP